MIRALIVFAITFILIVARRLRWLPIGRPAGALIGAALAVVTGAISPTQAWQSIDASTIGLLLGMMLINAHLEWSGAFRRLAARLDGWPKHPAALMCVVAAGAGIGSALLLNDAVCIVGAPVAMAIADRRRLRPLPMLMALACGSNVGGVMTLTGTPQCMIIGQQSKISYASYAATMVPVGLLALATLCLVLLVIYRNAYTLESSATLTASDHTAAALTLVEEPSLLAPSTAVLAFVTLGFALRFDLAWTSIAGAAALLLISRRDTSRILSRVDGSLLLFFAALFVVVGSLRTSGVLAWLVTRVSPWFSRGASSVVPLAAVSVLLSNLVSNVPYVLLFGPTVSALTEPRLMWFALAMASTFAGNLTLIGSVANIIVAEVSGERGGMTFVAYLRVGLAATILTTITGIGALLAMDATGWIALTASW